MARFSQADPLRYTEPMDIENRTESSPTAPVESAPADPLPPAEVHLPLKDRASAARREVRENVACLVALLALAFLLLLPAWTRGEVPIRADYAYTLAPWHPPEAKLVPADALLSKAQATRYLPWYVFLSDSVARGDSLLWNPREGAGSPFMALWRTRVFSPFSLPFYVLPLATAFKISALLKLIVAGVCAFYVGRRFGLAAPLALLLAAAYQMSGHVLLRLDAPLSDVAPWLPLLLLFTEQIAVEYWLAWPFGSLVWALMLFGGEPELAAVAAGFTAVYLAWRFATERARPGEIVGGFLALGLSLALGAGLAAIQILPFLEFVREAASTGKFAVRTPMGLTDAALLFVPPSLSSLHESASDPEDLSRALTTPLLYLGVVPLVMLPLWASVRRFAAPRVRARVEGLLATALLFTVVGALLSRIPAVPAPISGIGIDHYLAFNAFAAAYASACAAQQWVLLNARQCTVAIPRFLIVLGVLFVLVLVLAFLSGAVGVRAALLTVVGVLLLLGVLGVTLLRPSARTLGYATATLAAASLFLAGPRLLSPWTPAERLIPGSPFTDALEATGHRIAGSPRLASWPLALNGIPQFYSSADVQLKRHRLFASRLDEEPALIRRIGTPSLLLTGDDIQGPFARLRPELESRNVFDARAILFQDLNPLPRARMAYAGRTVESMDPRLIDPDRPPLMEAELPPLPASNGEAKVAVATPESNTALHITVESAQPGVLIVSDAWYPGWKAVVDGQEKDVFPVDGLFRGVALPEGSHDVLMIYDPLIIELGLGISVVAAILIAAGLGAVVYGRYTRRPHASPTLIPPG